jgi:hypothetical protein
MDAETLMIGIVTGGLTAVLGGATGLFLGDRKPKPHTAELVTTLHTSPDPLTATHAHGLMAAIDGLTGVMARHTSVVETQDAVGAQKARIAAAAEKIEPHLASLPAEPAEPVARMQPDMPAEMLAPFAPPKQSDADRMESAARRQEAMLAAMQALHERMTELAMPQPVPAATPAAA